MGHTKVAAALCAEISEITLHMPNPESRLQVLRLFDRKIPDVHIKQTRHGALGGYLEALWVLGVRCVTSSVLFRWLFVFLPDLMLKMLSRGTLVVWRALSRVRRVDRNGC